MRKQLRRFWRQEHGSGTVFMVAMLPAFLAVAGLAIDAASAYRTRNILQGAADAASLAASLALPDTNAATAAAISYAKLNLPNNGTVLAAADVESGNWNASTRTFTKGATPLNSVRVTTRMTAATGNALPTTFLRIIGVDHWDINAQAISVADQPKLWVALVLDNSSSMTESDKSRVSKISALKTGAKNLLNTLKTASVHTGDVQMSIVPFTKHVGLGTSYANASWLNWSDFNAPPPAIPGNKVGPGSTCPWSLNIQGYQCQTTPTNDANARNASAPKVPSKGTYSGYICPTSDGNGHFYNGCYTSVKTGGSGSNTTYKHTWVPNAKSTWTGCVMDRDQDYDTMNDLPATGSTMVWPENSTYCPIPMLTPMHTLATADDVTYFSGQIDALNANGYTNQTIGLDFGWLSITPGMPLSPVTPVQPSDTQRYIILFSDGLNTINRWEKSSDSSRPDATIDARTKLACDHAKADGVVIFTVYVDLNNTTGSSDVLEYCASNPKSTYYFDLTTSGSIITTFDKIGQQIMRMHLVH
jgi:Flp pilus assembly protein TadG